MVVGLGLDKGASVLGRRGGEDDVVAISISLTYLYSYPVLIRHLTSTLCLIHDVWLLSFLSLAGLCQPSAAPIRQTAN